MAELKITQVRGVIGHAGSSAKACGRSGCGRSASRWSVRTPPDARSAEDVHHLVTVEEV
jgi:hypothetical protein